MKPWLLSINNHKLHFISLITDILAGSGTDVVSPGDGRIADIRVKSGEMIYGGEIVVRLDQPELLAQINTVSRNS
jgi:multidrug efflux pump subunit AcrA (membrane-fusion protein)